MSASTALIAATPPPDPPTRRRGLLRLGAAVAGAALLLAGLLVVSGVDAGQAVRVALVVGVQLGTGAVLWLIARGPVATSVAEILGMGLALGTLTALLGSQLLLPLGAASWGWLLPSALLAIASALPATRRRLRSAALRAPGVLEVGAILGGTAVGLVFLRRFWGQHPLEWSGWWAYYLDIPHHEALSVSLSTWGPGDHILVAGDPLRYHWFAHAWAGGVTDASSAEPFVVITRALPLVALIGTVCLAWAWAQRLSDRRSAPVLAVVVTMLATNVGTRADLDYWQVFTLSPSQGLSSLWLLGAALVLTEFVRDRVAWGVPLLALLAVGCMGGKTSHAAVLGGGVGLLALASLWRPDLRARAWQAFAAIALALVGAFVAVILGSTGNLRLEAGLTAETFGVLPERTWPGVVVGTVGVVLLYSAKWAGLTALVVDRRAPLRPEVWFGAGVAITGLLLTAVLGHPGNSQLWFPSSAGVLLGVLSAWGLAEALGVAARGWIVAAVLVGAIAGTLGVVGLPGADPWTAPYVVWLLPLVLAVGTLVRGIRVRGVAASVLAWCLVSAGVATGVVVVAETARTAPPAPPAPNAPFAFTASHEEAFRWLRENSDVDDVVVTNRQCASPVPASADCELYRWFLTAALGQRRMYVEGADYAAGDPHPAWVRDRIELSRRFVEEPTRADAEVLWDAGVRWVVVDLAATRTRDWAPFAEPAFSTDTTEVLRLVRP